MTRTEAARAAKKRWGKKAHLEVGPELSSPEKRDAQKARNDELRTRRDAITADIEARLKALDWYQALIAERRQLLKELQDTQWNAGYHRFQVGEVFGIGFHVAGRGDTWEEAFKQADDRKAADEARRKSA